MKTSWSKILFIVCDVVLAAYIVLAFASFDRKAESKVLCNKVNIEIADNATSGFLDAKVIKSRLEKTGDYPFGKPLAQVNTRRIEETLCASPFVKTAECYKTEGGHVYISVTQRMPVIRIKADNGDDYYVDDNDCIMPRTNYTSDLIIATGSISRRYATSYMSPLGKAIMQDDLWKNLIEQINVTPDAGIELVPRIGDHVVYIGRLPDAKNRKEREKAIADFVDSKLTRLMKFYKYGLSQVGWNKYSYVNIEFDNQIICKKSGSGNRYHAEQPTPQQPTEVDGHANAVASPDGSVATEAQNADVKEPVDESAKSGKKTEETAKKPDRKQADASGKPDRKQKAPETKQEKPPKKADSKSDRTSEKKADRKSDNKAEKKSDKKTDKKSGGQESKTSAKPAQKTKPSAKKA